MKKGKEIENLYAIFAEQNSNPNDLVLTKKGAEKLLDKINEIIDCLNKNRLKKEKPNPLKKRI